MPITRRVFVGVTVATFAAAVGGSSWLSAHSPEAYVRSVVRERLSYLSFGDDVLDQFTADFMRYSPAMADTRGRVISATGVVLSRALSRIAGSTWEDRVAAFEEKVASDFLLATDFFDEGRDISRQLSYILFPEPYEFPCRNPLAEIG